MWKLIKKKTVDFSSVSILQKLPNIFGCSSSFSFVCMHTRLIWIDNPQPSGLVVSAVGWTSYLAVGGSSLVSAIMLFPCQEPLFHIKMGTGDDNAGG